MHPTNEPDTTESSVSPDADQSLVATDLIEEVSIDGMCGVY